MANEILMPKMGMTMKEGTVEEWYVREGDQVKTGDPLFSASTDKITNDVESQEDGMILKIVAQAGETVDVSAVVGYIGKPGEQVPDAPGGETQAAPEADHTLSEEKHAEAAPAPAANHTVKASPAAKKLAKEKGIDLTQVAGTGPGGRIKIEDVEMFIEDQNNVKASPAAAKAAADLGVHLADAKAGSGRVMMEDVLKAAAG
ncbi:MAG: E3 binding domain-containing protein, partial [Eubacterium sp.]|nr:E3 binding domain-containing protein [Eubacterium sp.]